MNDRIIFLRRIGRVSVHSIYEAIISLKNIFTAWSEFQIGKKNREDVAKFSLNAEKYIFNLAQILTKEEYRHNRYEFFKVSDPKPRDIHKATVLDRVLHHAIVRILSPVFDKIFIFDSYSSRKEKGSHKAIQRFIKFAWKLSRNNTKTVWILKCDIKKYFDSVNHEILIDIINKQIPEEKLQKVLTNIIKSFAKKPGRGIPLGNLTSQLFSNIYLNELDQFLKRKIPVRYYIRYADDFVIMDTRREYLEKMTREIENFLNVSLDLQLNKNKVSIHRWHNGVDFLGYVIFPYFIILRAKTRKRMIRNIKIAKEKYQTKQIDQQKFEAIISSYFAILKHCRSEGIKNEIRDILNS